MRVVRPLVVALSALVGALGCDRSPTGPPHGSAPSAQTACSAPAPGSGTQGMGSNTCAPTVGLQAHRDNYAVAW
jgi:hypothetical protein